MKRIGVAVIGSGYWGVNYIRMFNELPQSWVAVVCDQRPDRLEQVEKRFPGVDLTVDLAEVLARPDVHAAVICTPATIHFQVAKACLEAGKHLLVEKPITTVSADAEKLISLAAERSLVLMVGHTFIHNPGIQKVKSFVRHGDLGRPYYLYARRTNMGPIRRDVNALWDLATHDISIFNHLLESVPQWVSAVGARVLENHLEDVGFISMGYPGGVVGHIHVSWADPNKVREIVVVGSDRRIVFDDLNAQERVRVFEKGIKAAPAEAASYEEHQFQMRDGDIISPKIEVREPLKEQSAHFLECVAGNAQPITTGLHGLEVVRVMEAIDRSVQLMGAPVRVEGAPEGEPGRDGLRGLSRTELARAMWDTIDRSIEQGHVLEATGGEP